MRTKSKLFVSLAALLWIASPPAFAQELERGRGGTLACGGTHGFQLAVTRLRLPIITSATLTKAPR